MLEFEWTFEIKINKIRQSLYTISRIWRKSNLWKCKKVFHKYDTWSPSEWKEFNKSPLDKQRSNSSLRKSRLPFALYSRTEDITKYALQNLRIRGNYKKESRILCWKVRTSRPFRGLPRPETSSAAPKFFFRTEPNKFVSSMLDIKSVKSTAWSIARLSLYSSSSKMSRAVNNALTSMTSLKSTEATWSNA